MILAASINLFVLMTKGKKLRSDDMTPLQRLEKAKNLEGDSVTYKVLIPYDEATDTYTLGPIFNQHLPTYDKLFPNHNNDPLMFSKSNVMDIWVKSHAIRSWPIPSQDYLHWLDRVEVQYNELWREIGIFDLIQFSRFRIPPHNYLLLSGLCFWSRTSNCFLFRSAMMTITLYDLGVMFNIPPYGIEISALLEVDLDLVDISFGRNDLSYGTFIRLNKGSTRSVSVAEHVAFLLYWLCKFIFCTASIKIVKEHLKIAIALANGKKLALGPCILAHLYRGISDLLPTSTANTFSNSGGPLWILQFWLLAYFPEIRHPIPMPEAQALPNYGQYIKLLTPKVTDFKSLMSFFYETHSRPSEFHCPFRPARFGPSWAFFSYDAYKPCDNVNGLVDWVEAWRSILIARDLNFGSVLGQFKNNKCGVETYNPHFVARQFGLVQSIPYPIMFSANTSLYERTIFTSIEDVKETCQFLSLLSKDLVLVEFAVNPNTNPLFNSWWKSYVGNHMAEPFSLVCGRQSFVHLDDEALKELQSLEFASSAEGDHVPLAGETAVKLGELVPNPILDAAPPKKKARLKENGGSCATKLNLKVTKNGLTSPKGEKRIGGMGSVQSSSIKDQAGAKPSEDASGHTSSKQPSSFHIESSLPDTIDNLLEYLEILQDSPNLLPEVHVTKSLKVDARREDELKIALKKVAEALSIGPTIFLEQEAYKELKDDLQKISTFGSNEVMSIGQRAAIEAFSKELHNLSVRYTIADNLLKDMSAKRKAQEVAKRTFEMKVDKLKEMKIITDRNQERIQKLEAELAILKGEQDHLLAESKIYGRIAEENIMLSKSLMVELHKLLPKEEAARKDLEDVSCAFDTLKSSLL